MPRQRRVVLPGRPHHITQRGNNRRDVFFEDRDHELYLSLLREYTGKYQVQILGYCLMTNHVHLIAVPADATGLAKAIGRVHNDYARWLHIRRRESGHLWQNRFFSCPLEDAYTWAALAYVERNPVRAGMVAQCEEWPWSSARQHLGRADWCDWLAVQEWSQNWTPALWRVALPQPASAFSAMLILNRKLTRWLELFSKRLLSPNRAVSIHAAVHWTETLKKL